MLPMHRLTEQEIDELKNQLVAGEPCPVCDDTTVYYVSPSGHENDDRLHELDCPVCDQRRIGDSLNGAIDDESALAEYAEALEDVPVPTVLGEAAKEKLRAATTVVSAAVKGLKSKGRAA